MVTMTVRDIRQRWPAAEKALAEEGEIVVTRDSVPVARLLRYAAPAAPAEKVKRFDGAAHLRWLRRAAQFEPAGMRLSDDILKEMRNKGHASDEPLS